MNHAATCTQNPEGLISRLSRVPTPLGGLALGIASLGGAWALLVPEQSGYLRSITAFISAVLIAKILLKFFLHPHLLKSELSHPVVSSVMPTCAMATMVVAQAALPFSEAFAQGLWLTAVIVHLCLLMGFVVFRVRSFELEHMVPSWFVPPVGIIVAAVTSPGMGHDSLAQGLFLFGLSCYFIKLPVMLYRLLFRTTIPDAALPTFAIMAAPASLSLVGYLTITKAPDLLLILVLASLAVFMTFMVYIAFIKLLQLPFSPSYAAFTFPMVIGATALLKLEPLVQTTAVASFISSLGRVELLVATLIVTYVAVRYLWHYLGAHMRNA